MVNQPPRGWGRFAGLLLFAALLAIPAPGSGDPEAEPAPERGTSKRAQVFEANLGQAVPGVAFLSRGGGFAVRIEREGAELLFPAFRAGREARILRLEFSGRSSTAPPTGEDPLPGKVNYLAGSDPGGWITGIPTFSAIRYRDLYPGIDLRVSGDFRRLWLDFEFSPEADGASIELGIESSSRVAIDETSGDLLIGEPGAGARLLKPEGAGFLAGEGRIRLEGPALRPGTHRLLSTALAPSLPAPDIPSAEPDPGAPSAEPDSVARVAVDREGNLYLAGRTISPAPGGAEAFVTRIDRGATSPRYTTYFGGGGDDVPLGLAVTASQEVVLAGSTTSNDFPVAKALQPLQGGGGDGFVMKLAADGASVDFSSYFGGAGDDEARAVAVDEEGDAWIAGRTAGLPFPITPGLPPAGIRGGADAFVAGLTPDGLRLLRADLLGGSSDDEADALGVDPEGRLWVAGNTRSADFPGVPATGGGFLLALEPEGGAPVLTGLPGGDCASSAGALAVAPAGAVHVVTEPGAAGAPALSVTGAPVRQACEAPGGSSMAVIPSGAGRGASLGFARKADAIPGRILGIAVDADGTAWLVGSEEQAGRTSPLAVRIAGDGKSVKRFRRGIPDEGIELTGIALDPRGGPIVAGVDRESAFRTAKLVEAAPFGGVLFAGPLQTEAAGCPGTIQFDNSAGTGLWQTGANWNLDRLPDETDDVCIPAGMSVTLSTGSQAAGSLFVEAGASLAISIGTLTLSAPSQIDGGLTLTGGTLGGTGDLAVNGTFAWSGGAMTGAATTSANAGITITGTGVKDLASSRVLDTAGTVTWTGTGQIRLGTGGTIHNSGTWLAQSDASLTNSLGGTTLFENLPAAVFQKTSGAGVTTLDVPFTNAGSLSILTGTVSLAAGGTASGSFTGSAGTTLRFGGGTHALDASTTVDVPTLSVTTGTLNVDGLFSVTSGTAITGGTMTLNPGATLSGLGASLSITSGSLILSSGEPVGLATLTLSSGSLQGTDTVSVSGTTTWTGGTMTGAATTNANGGIAFGGAGVKDLTGSRVLNTSGSTTWTGTGQIRLGPGAVIHNSGTWSAQSDALLSNNLGGTPLFDNQASGVFQKTAGTGVTTLDILFDNAGSLDVGSGTVSLAGGGTGTGSFTGSGGSTLRFGGGSYTLDSLSTVNVPAVAVTAGSLTVNGAFTATTATTLSAGTATFNPAATLSGLGALSLGVGTLVLNSGEPVNVTTLSLSASCSLEGTDTVTVSGATTWTGGVMTGAGTTNANGGISFGGASVKDLTASRLLNTAGSSTWSGTGQIRVGSGASIHNTGAWDVQSDAIMSILSGSVLFENASGATFTKSAGAGTTSLDLPFINAGTLSVQTGTVSLSSGTGSGSFTGADGTTLEFSGGTYTLESDSILSVSAVSVTSGTLDVRGAFAATAATNVSAGSATFHSEATVASVGTALSVQSGVLDLSSGEPIAVSTLSLSGGTLQGTDTVSVSGTTSWSGGEMTGAATTNANGGIALGSSSVKDLTASRVLNTAGTTTWSDTGPLRIGSGASIHNTGVWDIQADATLADLVGAAPFENAAGATFQKSAGSGSTNINIPFDNAGTLSVQSGTISLNGGGTGTGSFLGSGDSTLRFGNGTYTLADTSTVNVPTAAVAAGVLDVSGAFTATATGITGGTMTFHPEATLLGLGGALSVSVGTLDLSSGEAVGVTTLALSQGTLQGSDTLTVSGTTSWISGTMAGAGITNAGGGIGFSGSAPKDLAGSRVLNTSATTTWTGSGPIRLGTGTSIHNSGTWDAQGNAALSNLLGGIGSFENLPGGTFKKSAGAGATTVAIPFSNAGNVRALAQTLSFTGGYSQTAGSVTLEGGTLSSTSPLDIQGGSVGGSGTIAADVASTGHLSPGLSPGQLAIAGAFLQNEAGAFDVEIGGLVPGTEHDFAGVTGAATLGGSLDVTLVNGFLPEDLDTFTIMTFGSSTGGFTYLNLPSLAGDLVWKFHHNPTSIVLEVLADLDGDGVRNLDDCAPADPTAWSLPTEVSQVAFAADSQTLSWGSLAVQAGPATVYDLMRGLVSQLPMGGGAAEICLVSGSAVTQAADPSAPASGAVSYYLSRGSNVCGKGPYGSTSGGTPRMSSVCP